LDKTAIAVESHYARGKVLSSILDALRAAGKDLARLSSPDLAAVDEFHIRGREATVELAARAALKAGQRVLDVGSGLGGSARYLATEYGCRTLGIDLTQEYVDTANALARMVGLDKLVEYRRASALDIPEAPGSFDAVWTEHVQMNIADKRRFYGEIARVLTAGGRLIFHDIFRGHGELHYPVPWADMSSISFLATPDEVRELLPGVGLRLVDWEDTTARSLEWFTTAVQRIKASGPPPLGIHLLMGETALAKLDNMERNLREGRIVVAQAVAEKLA
jgi:ubiquinone/menaquinone biosynthesis C-methylase UbiE